MRGAQPVLPVQGVCRRTRGLDTRLWCLKLMLCGHFVSVPRPGFESQGETGDPVTPLLSLFAYVFSVESQEREPMFAWFAVFMLLVPGTLLLRDCERNNVRLVLKSSFPVSVLFYGRTVSTFVLFTCLWYLSASRGAEEE